MATIDQIVSGVQNVYLQPKKEAEKNLAALPNDAALVKKVTDEVFESIQALLGLAVAKAAREHQTLSPTREHPVVFTYYHGAKTSSVNIHFAEYWKRVGQICWKSVADSEGAFNDYSDEKLYSNYRGWDPSWKSQMGMDGYTKARYDALCALNLQERLLEVNNLFFDKVAEQLVVKLKEFAGADWDYRIVAQPLNIIESEPMFLGLTKTKSVLKVVSLNVYLFKKTAEASGEKIVHVPARDWVSFVKKNGYESNPVFEAFDHGNEAMKTQVTGFDPRNPELNTFLTGDEYHPLFGYQ